MFQQLLQEDFWIFLVVSTGAYYPLVAATGGYYAPNGKIRVRESQKQIFLFFALTRAH